jgi:hypothetical protein
MISLPFAFRPGVPTSALQSQPSFMQLFNGKDLAGWDTWLGRPHKPTDVPGLSKNEQGDYVQPIGLNRDPRSVFSVVEVDGGPAIRISGETYGGLITRDEYEDYHLRLEFKWGTKRWPPREQAVRDSGCCYHSIGPHDESYGFWMKSFEFQIQEGDCGDFYSLAGVIADAEAVARNPLDPRSELLYRKGAPAIIGTTRRTSDRPVERDGPLLLRADERPRRQRTGQHDPDRSTPQDRGPRAATHQGPDSISVRGR